MEKCGSYPPKISGTSVLIDSQFLELISLSLLIATMVSCGYRFYLITHIFDLWGVFILKECNCAINKKKRFIRGGFI